MRRVVVTGMGLLTSAGKDVRENWQNIIAGVSGISHIESFDTTNSSVKIAGEIKEPQHSKNEANFSINLEDFIDPKEIKKMDKFMAYSLMAAEEALTQANWKPTDENDRIRTGTIIGSGIGGIDTIERNTKKMVAKSPKFVSPFFVPSSIINLASGYVSMKYGFNGPNCAVTTACATGGHAIYHASHIIKAGDADIMVVGGAESCICELAVAGFANAKALSKSFSDEPRKASRPWDKARDGFVMGEGAGVLVLEEYEHAKKRGANIICELYGGGASGDAHHITAPHPEGLGAKLAMKMAIKNSGISAKDIGYINAHGTSTPLGDMAEINAVREVIGIEQSKIIMSSTKSAIGHCLGAAGAIEAIYSIMALNTGDIPPTLNLEEVEDGTEDFDLMPLKSRNIGEIKAVLSNSFGFGGTNSSVVFGKVRS
ncbi:MAG: 3-oxoacyl-[acyl-carrier-protein] synthase II [Candidatus Deianiraeaceae bacterium]|jgi:3-oxoacyl-[acyl-carrier-protein] synthase II